MTLRCHIEQPVVEPGRHTYDQATLAEALRRRLDGLVGADPIQQMIGFIYEHSAIEHRHLEFSLAELAERRDWYLLVNQATASLARRTLARLIRPDQPAASIDALIVVSSSFAGFPALSRILQVELELRLDAICYDLTGLGCAGPTHGLHLASMLIATGCQRVAVICVDVLGSHGESRVHNQVPSMSQLVAHCLASDGGAGLVVSREPTGPESLAWTETRLDSRLWPDSLAENDFTASSDNQPFIAVGKAIRTRLLDELGPVLATLDPETTLFHPGGASLMRALESADPRLAATLAVSNTVLREHGNIGSASVLWVLAAAWQLGRPLGPELRLLALGPGIVTTQLRLSGVVRG